MTREEEIKQQSIIYTDNPCNYKEYGDQWETYNDIEYVEKAFKEGAKWADKTMINKACEWLNMNIIDYITEGSREGISLENQKQLIDDFRKAMEE